MKKSAGIKFAALVLLLLFGVVMALRFKAGEKR